MSVLAKSDNKNLTEDIEAAINTTNDILTVSQIAEKVNASDYDRHIIHRRLMYLTKTKRIRHIGTGRYQRVILK